MLFVDAKVQQDKEMIVSEIRMKNKKSQGNPARDILLRALVLVVLAGLGRAGYATASGSDSQELLPDQISIFDPFALSSTVLTAGPSSGAGSVNLGGPRLLSARPLILIPSRPALRSPFRPPLSWTIE